MGRLVKVVVLLAVLVVGAVLLVRYVRQSSQGRADRAVGAQPREQSAPMQPQEKYGFAPTGE